MYSASIVELAIQECLIFFQTMAPPLRINTDSDVDFVKFLFDWKSKLGHPIGIKSLPKYTST